jgi:hypothetical protein
MIVKQLTSSIRSLKDVKKKEIIHFEGKVFDIDKRISATCKKHKKLISKFEK